MGSIVRSMRGRWSLVSWLNASRMVVMSRVMVMMAFLVPDSSGETVQHPERTEMFPACRSTFILQ